MLVEVWSDVVCPWCAIGRAHLSTALDAWDHRDEVEVRWRSFELDPQRSRSLDPGQDYVGMLSAKYRTTRDEARSMVDRMTAAGREVGVHFDFDAARPGNTFDAHRLLHLAVDRGVQHPLKARLLDAYHGEGAAIGEHATLRSLAVEVGLDGDEVDGVLAGDRYADDVRRDEATAAELGITGVPGFVVDRRAMVGGAQPPEVLLQVLDRARDGDLAERDRIDLGLDDRAEPACVDGVCVV